MMKWKITKGPRCASADRSSDYLRKVEQLPDPNRIRTTFTSNDFCGKSNGTVQQHQRLSSNTEKDIVPLSENRKRTQNHEGNRKSSFVATDCINLKGIFGLSRDRSDAPYSSLTSALENGRRRSRSEARGTSIDRLTVAYHGTPLIGPQHYINQNGNCKNGTAAVVNAKKPKNASPGEKSGCWVRGRRREREPRDPCPNGQDCRTVVEDTKKKPVNPKKVVPNGRTITDSSNNDCEFSKAKNRECKVIAPVSTADELLSLGKENVEINFNNDGNDHHHHHQHHQPASLKEEDLLLLDVAEASVAEKAENKPRKNRKKRIAPKPQRVSFLDEDKNGRAGVTDTGNDLLKISDLVCNEAEQMASIESTSHSHENDHSTSSSSSDTSGGGGGGGVMFGESVADTISERTISVLAEIHSNHNVEMEADEAHVDGDEQDNDILEIEDTSNIEAMVSKDENTREDSSVNTNGDSHPCVDGLTNEKRLEPNGWNVEHFNQNDCNGADDVESLVESARSQHIEQVVYSNANDGHEATEETAPTNDNDHGRGTNAKELPFSHLLPDVAEISEIFNGECKIVGAKDSRDLVVNGSRLMEELFNQSASESNTDETKTDLDETFDTADSICGDVLQNGKIRNRSSFADDANSRKNNSQSSDTQSPEPPPRKRAPNNNHSMRVNVVVKNPQNGSEEKDPSSGFVVKKSFVLTVAKQEEGFRSLCAKKDVATPCLEPDKKSSTQQISVTFLCAAPKEETDANGIIDSTTQLGLLQNNLRLRSLSVPPNNGVAEAVVASVPSHRSFSKDRRPKDRQSAKRKSHRSRKKDNLFNMPQAVIDELSQVLEHRKRVPDAEAC